jgi:hypothetical protein
MRKSVPLSIIIILSALVLILGSCVAGSCFEETESYVKASFYTGEGTPSLHAPDTLTLYGLNQDSILYNKKTNIQTALIPLNASSDTSLFVIVINGVTDTVEFRYISYPHLISKECGYTFYHQLDSGPRHTIHAIKDIYIGNRTITNLNGENIRIFY